MFYFAFIYSESVGWFESLLSTFAMQWSGVWFGIWVWLRFGKTFQPKSHSKANIGYAKNCNCDRLLLRLVVRLLRLNCFIHWFLFARPMRWMEKEREGERVREWDGAFAVIQKLHRKVIIRPSMNAIATRNSLIYKLFGILFWIAKIIIFRREQCTIWGLSWYQTMF